MKTLKFKTNINCGGCVAAVTPHLNAVQGIDKWAVDLTSDDRVLTVETDVVAADAVVKALEKVGYTATAI